PEIIKDLELMEVELCIHGFEGYIGHKVEPNLILQIKEAQKQDGELWFMIENLKNEVVLTEVHSSPFSIHPGSTKMYRDLKQNFWWNGMKHDVARFLAKCLTCQQVKIEHQCVSGLLQPLDIPTWKWDQISMDFVTGLPRTFKKNDTICVVIDRLTKLAHFLTIQQGGVRCFGLKGKLSARFIGPFEILDRVGAVSYRLVLPSQLSHVHNVFHVSLLRGNNYHPLHAVQYPFDNIRKDLSFAEEPEAILDS
ncbi:retrotransposon protein, putative, ty3-gypsy subclass, partial [Tanacetum coccineum]